MTSVKKQTNHTPVFNTVTHVTDSQLLFPLITRLQNKCCIMSMTVED